MDAAAQEAEAVEAAAELLAAGMAGTAMLASRPTLSLEIPTAATPRGVNKRVATPSNYMLFAAALRGFFLWERIKRLEEEGGA